MYGKNKNNNKYNNDSESDYSDDKYEDDDEEEEDYRNPDEPYVDRLIGGNNQNNYRNQNNNNYDAELQRIMRLSMVETTKNNIGKPVNDFVDDNNDKELKRILELSKLETKKTNNITKQFETEYKKEQQVTQTAKIDQQIVKQTTTKIEQPTTTKIEQPSILTKVDQPVIPELTEKEESKKEESKTTETDNVKIFENEILQIIDKFNTHYCMLLLLGDKDSIAINDFMKKNIDDYVTGKIKKIIMTDEQYNLFQKYLLGINNKTLNPIEKLKFMTVVDLVQ